MKVFTAPRQKGKTRLAVDAANASDGYLVVKDRHEAQRVMQNYKCDRMPVTYADVLQGRMKGSWVRNIVIDNIDDFVVYACQGLRVDLGTIDRDFVEPHRALQDLERRKNEHDADREERHRKFKEEQLKTMQIMQMLNIIGKTGESNE